jgi:hypothetical protein
VLSFDRVNRPKLPLCPLCLCGDDQGWGFPPVALLLFIIGGVLVFFFIIGGAFTSEPEAGLPLIIFLSSSGEGMPGVGVAPGLNGFLSSASLGMPGVGVPFGNFEFAAAPGAPFAFVITGLAEMPGGMFAGSSFTSAGFAFEFAFAEAVEFDDAPPPQPNKNNVNRKNEKIMKFLNIIQISSVIINLSPSSNKRFDITKPLIYTYKFALV